MTHHLFKDLGKIKGKAFDDTLDFFSSEPIIEWITGMNLNQLGNLSTFVTRLRLAKTLLNEKPESIEARNIRKQLTEGRRNPKISGFIKMISKYDIPSLIDTEKTLDILFEKKIRKEDNWIRLMSVSPEEKAKEEREKEEGREREYTEKMRRRERREERKGMSELERRIENHRNLDRAGLGFMDFLNHGDDIRHSDFPFTEPAPGCKYNVSVNGGNVIIPMKYTDLKEFLLKTRDYLYDIAYQLFDRTGRKVSLNILSVSKWARVIHEHDGKSIESIETHTHNTKFRTYISRNQIKDKCDEITEMLTNKFLIPHGESGLYFKESILVRVEYYANMSDGKKNKGNKYKGGQWVDHRSIPCFTTRVRTEDLKAMDNYTTNKNSYIYNITNMNDNLCFIRYIALINFITTTQNVPYISHDNPQEKFKDYNVQYQTPLINPSSYAFIDLLLPFLNYPCEEINERAGKIRNKYFPGKSGRDILDYKPHHNKEYISECGDFAHYLNHSTLFPVNADDAELIENFEKLNNVTMNIFALNQEAYSEDCTKKLHELWNARYITNRPAKSLTRQSHIDLMLIREVSGYSHDEKRNVSLPVYRSHYILLLNSIELATDQRRKNVHTLQCLKCKKHFRGRTRESTKGMLYFHEENNECIDRSITYNIPHNRIKI